MSQLWFKVFSIADKLRKCCVTILSYRLFKLLKMIFQNKRVMDCNEIVPVYVNLQQLHHI